MHVVSKKALLFILMITLSGACPAVTHGQGLDSTVAIIALDYDTTIRPPYTFLPHKTLRRAKVGLALSGGGLRGLAQIGVIQVLVERDIPIDFIAGTSIGSIVGGALAAGYSPEALWEIARDIEWEHLISDAPPRSSLYIGQKEEQAKYLLQIRFEGLKPYFPQAITPGQQLTNTLADLIMTAPCGYISDFDSLCIPLRIIATDISTGEKVVLKSGSLIDAMRASIAIPLLFTPVEYKDRVLGDGGLVDNIPVLEVDTSDIDICIAIDTTSPLRRQNDLNLPWLVADQVTTIMQVNHNKEMLDAADLVISFADDSRSSTDATDLDSLYEVGKRKARMKVGDILALLREHEAIGLSDTTFFIDEVRYNDIDLPPQTYAPAVRLPRPHALISKVELHMVLRELFSSGYFDDLYATVSRSNFRTVLSFHLRTNPLLEGVQFTGTTSLPHSQLMPLITSQVGWPINHLHAQRDLKSIATLYREKGYSLARISDVTYDGGIITVKIDEGTITAIELRGNTRTRDVVILRELGVTANSIFNLTRIKQGVQNIYATGLFETVTYNIEEPRKGTRKLLINVKERPYEVARLGARYDRERGSRGFLELTEQNLLGSGVKILGHLQHGDMDQRYALNLRADRIFKTYATFSLDLYHTRQKQYTYAGFNQIGEYRQASTGLLLSFGQQITRLGTVSLETKFENIDMLPLAGRVYQAGNMNLKTITLRSVIDTQDQLPFPARGKYHIFLYEHASGSLLNSQVSFLKVYSSFNSWYTIKGRHTLHPKLIWGSCDNTTPFSEQFRLGGQYSFLGLRDEEMVGRHLINLGLEYRLLIPWELPASTYVSLHYDLGAVWRSALDVKPRDFTHSLGLSLAFNTALGPLSLAYGRLSDGRSCYYFSVGYQL